MKKSIQLLIILLLFSITSNSQITKGNWLLSGNASFSMLQYGSEGTVRYKQTNLQLAPSVGYFLKDKLAVGLRPALTYGSNNISLANSETIFTIGPFVRYYLLKPANVFNILTEGSYLYGTFKSGPKQNTFSFAAGPVIYFNSSVGLEFLLGYASTKVAHFAGNNNELKFSIGFHFNLEKEK